MWRKLFFEVLNMSITASVAILFVLPVRAMLKKVPKLFSYMLWAVVLFRLLCPVSFSNTWSLFGGGITADHTGRISYSITDSLRTAQAEGTFSVSNQSETTDTGFYSDKEQKQPDISQRFAKTAAFVWLAGIAGMLGYSALSLRRLHARLTGAVLLRRNIYLSDYIESPFVSGWIRPRIYLPSALAEKEQGYIILHEQTHIKRGDHFAKGLFFLALSLHWFNPLVWAAFVLFTKDMEMSCDEAVIQKVSAAVRSDYCTSLLNLASGRRGISGLPPAFGEGDVKSRIKHVINYKKPAVIVVIAAGVCVIAASALLAANPLKKKAWRPDAVYQATEVIYDAPWFNFIYPPGTEPYYCITEDDILMEKQQGEDAEWISFGRLSPVRYSEKKLFSMVVQYHDIKQLSEVSAVYRADVEQDQKEDFYLVMQTKNGEMLIAVCYGTKEEEYIRWLYVVEAIS